MKYLFILLFFIGFSFSYCQPSNNTSKPFKIENNRNVNPVNKPKQKEASIKIEIPLKIDLTEYTHLALVDASLIMLAGNKMSQKGSYKRVAEALANSPLRIINPLEYDKKKFKNDKRFLRDIKDSKWLYFYYSQSKDGPDYFRYLVVRDYNNKIVYKASTVNGFAKEIVDPLINF